MASSPGSPRSDVDWTRVSFFWGDERFVAPDSDDRDAKQAREAFLDAIGVDPARVHEIPSTADVETLEAAAAAYADTVPSRGTGKLRRPDARRRSRRPRRLALPRLPAPRSTTRSRSGSPARPSHHPSASRSRSRP